MRLDLFLKTCKLVKRRAVSHELCDEERVLVNGKEAKPAKDVKPGDVIVLRFPSKTIELEVLAVSTSRKDSIAENLYTVLSEIRLPKEKDSWSENR